MARQTVHAKITKGERASDILLQEMWRLRLDFLNLKISRDDDWERFRDRLKQPHTLLINFRDRDKQLQGFFTFAFTPVQHQEKKALLILSKYYYVRPEYRGHPKITVAAWRLLPKILFRYDLRQIYFVAFSFPTSFVSLSRTFGRVMTLQNPATPAWEKKVLEDFVRNQNGKDWDNSAQLIRHQNVPFGEDREASKGISVLREQYLELNPDWAEGNSLPIMMKFDWPTIQSLLQTNRRRSKRVRN